MKFTILMGIALLGGSLFFGTAWGAQELSDNDLDQITAGGTSVEFVNGKLQFQFGEDKGNRTVDASGTIEVRKESLEGTSFLEDRLPQSPSFLILRDNAQGNLKAFVNVNAVNSLVQILINLNININSTVGTLRQVNRVKSF